MKDSEEEEYIYIYNKIFYLKKLIKINFYLNKIKFKQILYFQIFYFIY